MLAGVIEGRPAYVQPGGAWQRGLWSLLGGSWVVISRVYRGPLKGSIRAP